MGDVADILGVRDGLAAAKAAAGASKKQAEKKPEGMSREVFALVGSGASLPSIMPTGGRIQEIIADKSRVVTPWVLCEFTNSARTDELKLKHWQRKARAQDDYAFAMFNRKSAVVQYTPEEYLSCVAGGDTAQQQQQRQGQSASGDSNGLASDKIWTQEETDTLFRLCQELNLRWFIIQDRWPGDSPPTVTEIKKRYYDVSKKVLQNRRKKKVSAAQRQASGPPGGADVTYDAAGIPDKATVSAKRITTMQNELYDFSYRKDYEDKRERQLELLYSRSLKDEATEAKLVQDIRRIDTYLRGLQKEAPAIKKKTKASAMSSKMPALLHPFPSSVVDSILRGEHENARAALKVKPGTVSKRSDRFKIEASQNGIGEQLKGKILDQVFKEILGLPIRPVPTPKVCDAWEKLVQDTVKLCAMQSKLFDLNAELQGLKGLPVPVRKNNKKRPVALVAAPGTVAAAQSSSSGGSGPLQKKKKTSDSKKSTVKIKLKTETISVAAGGGGGGADGASVVSSGSQKRKAGGGGDKGTSSKKKKT